MDIGSPGIPVAQPQGYCLSGEGIGKANCTAVRELLQECVEARYGESARLRLHQAYFMNFIIDSP